MTDLYFPFLHSTVSFYSWSFKRKWAATAIVSAFTFISPVSSSMIAPASDTLAAQFGITNTAVIALTTSVFVLAYGTFTGHQVTSYKLS